MTREEFKKRWELNANGGGITNDDIADCAVSWGIATRPRTMPIDEVRYSVLKAANAIDAEDFAPESEDKS